MSININSTQISALLKLYPMAIPGAVENLLPEGTYHLGIPESIHSPSTALGMVIDPVTLFSTDFAAGDSVRLWANGQATSVIKPIKPGEEQDPIWMELPWGWLKDGLNTLYYEVTRISGNKNKSDPILNLLFNNPVSDITASHPPIISPGQPATFTLTRAYPRAYDVMTLTVGTWSKTISSVHPADPVTYTLTTTDLQQIGDGTRTVSAMVIDQLSNSHVSPTSSIVITGNTLVLPPPTVKGQTGNNFDSTLQNVEVWVPQGTLLPTDEIHANWEGAISAPGASFTSPKRLVSAGLTFVVPRSVLAYSLGKVVNVTYVIKRNGVTTSSQVLPLNILPLPVTALIPPKIVEADANNVLDVAALGARNATIHALLWTLIADGMPCWLSLEGKKPDGSAHNLALWEGLPARVNPLWVSQGFWPEALLNSYLKQLGDGTSLRIKFAVSMDMSNVRATAVEFPDRAYTIKVVAVVNATITKVNENTATGALVANGGSTTATTLVISGTASPGQQVEVRNHNTVLDTVPANAQGMFSYSHLSALPGARRYTAKGLYGSEVVSLPWTVNVFAYGTIAVPQCRHLAINSSGTRLFVASAPGFPSPHHATLIDTVTREVIKVHQTTYPTFITVHPDDSKVYFNDQANLVEMDSSNFTVIRTQSDGLNRYPYDMEINPDGKYFYAIWQLPDTTFGELAIYNSSNFQIVKRINLQSSVYEIAVSRDGSRVYVINVGGDEESVKGSVSVVDARSLSLIKHIDVGSRVYSIGVSPDGNFVYVLLENLRSFVVIDTLSLVVVRTVTLEATTYAFAVGADGKFIYLSVGTKVMKMDAVTFNSVSIWEKVTFYAVVVSQDQKMLYGSNSQENLIYAIPIG
ncbi:YncE family protein [Pseudomonas sp. efr-133-TYG-5]|uniref:YncE family protein n=1 Tax=Pseudomonas sp. efr-133-TYG-5 TaxID=3040310 RepID=UPI0025577707|nr:YncE family protein [Pseudomonas sp. efr-133-TYG-5]